MRTASFCPLLALSFGLAAACDDPVAREALGARLGCPEGARAAQVFVWFGAERGCRLPDGRWHGPYESDWRNGEPRSRGRFEQGLEQGSWRFTTERGEPREEGEFRAGERVGRWRRYERGALQAEGEYAAGRPVGPWRLFDGQGRVVGEGRLEGGEPPEGQGLQSQRQGEWVTWTEARQRCQGAYRDGRKTGRWVCWHGPDGDPAPRWTEGEYLEGLEQGRWTAWYPNGQVQRTGEYRMGQRQGRWEELAGDGELIGWSEYRDGVMVRGERTRP
jgi:antitoxin component YwqK of YwqJK toxin-antitoxin module